MKYHTKRTDLLFINKVNEVINRSGLKFLLITLLKYPVFKNIIMYLYSEYIEK